MRRGRASKSSLLECPINWNESFCSERCALCVEAPSTECTGLVAERLVMCVDVGHATAQADVGPLGCSILHRPALRVSRACCGPHLRDAQLCGSSFAARRASPALLTTRSFAVVMLLPNALDLRAVRPRLLEADLEFSLPSRGVCVSWYVAHASSIGRHPASHLLLCAEALVEDHLLFVAGSEELDPVVRVGVARLQGLDLLHACGGVFQREAWVHGPSDVREPNFLGIDM